jgi:3-deoxy-7-phosphoheptulonate synthase
MAAIPYILAQKTNKNKNTIISLPFGKSIGGNTLALIAGPCTIESEEQIIKTAMQLKNTGISILRGGAFKPRSSPYSFQGLGKKGLIALKKAGSLTELPVITEILDTDDIPLVVEYADILQVGARNCQNYSLLKKLGKINKPVLLKRGLMTTIEELLLSAEYILSGGNEQVILCERGIRTFETETRNTLDISAIPILKLKTHLPVIVDPSHASGSKELICPLSLAAVSAGADGLMIEVHSDPENALCDGNQSLTPGQFKDISLRIESIANAIGRKTANKSRGFKVLSFV